MPTEAGKGEHHFYLLQRDGSQSDGKPIARKKHYLGVDAVRWYVNKASNVLRKRMASGTILIEMQGDTHQESYEVGLGTYGLQAGAHTAPVFDQPVLNNRIFLGGPITLKLFIGAIAEDTLLGGLLRDLAKASLDVVSGAIASATITGPYAVLQAAGNSLTTDVKKILNEGKKAATIFEPTGVNITVKANELLGAETYLLVHRGMALDRSTLRVTSSANGEYEVIYEDEPLDDGAWVLMRLRREMAFGSPRPWENDTQSLIAEIDGVVDRWRSGGITAGQAGELLNPRNADPPTIGDRLLAMLGRVRTDFVLTEAEAGARAGELRAILNLAQAAAEQGDPQIYYAGRQAVHAPIPQEPPLAFAQAFQKEVKYVAAARHAPDWSHPLASQDLWSNVVARAEQRAEKEQRSDKDKKPASSADIQFATERNDSMPDKDQHKWCFAWFAEAPLPPPDKRTAAEIGAFRAALVKANKWGPAEKRISIAFLDGDPAVQDLVTHAAQGWIDPGMADLEFQFVKDPDAALIRISFAYSGSWSVIGTTCKLVAKDQPTMNFGWLTRDTPDDEVQRVVLHEFGHALGLIHEHQNPGDNPIQWNKPAVYRDLSGPPNNWSNEVIDHNMFEAYDRSDTNFTKVDPLSIMMYPIPAGWTTNGLVVGLNKTLSPTDKNFIRECYGTKFGAGVSPAA